MEALRAADDLLVARMRLDHVHADDDCLVHPGGDDDAAALLTPAALALWLRLASKRLPLCRLLALRLRALTALGPRDALALLLGRSLGDGDSLLGRSLLGLLARRLLGLCLGHRRLVAFGDRLRLGLRSLGLGHGRAGLLGRSLGVRLGRSLGGGLGLGLGLGLGGLFRRLFGLLVCLVQLFVCHR